MSFCRSAVGKSPAMAGLQAHTFLTESDYYRSLNEKLSNSSRVREIKSVTIESTSTRVTAPKVRGAFRQQRTVQIGRRTRQDTGSDFPFGRPHHDRQAPPVQAKDQTENEKTSLSHAFNNAPRRRFQIKHKLLEEGHTLVCAREHGLSDTHDPRDRIRDESRRAHRKAEGSRLPALLPEILPNEEKRFSAEGLVNPVVALKVEDELVPNDFTFDSDGMLFASTGPNRGGKSVINRRRRSCLCNGSARTSDNSEVPRSARATEYSHFPQEARTR